MAPHGFSLLKVLFISWRGGEDTPLIMKDKKTLEALLFSLLGKSPEANNRRAAACVVVSLYLFLGLLDNDP